MTPRYAIQGLLIFLGLLFLQIFVLDLVDIAGFAKPIAFPLIVMLLPIYLPSFMVLLFAFAAGYVVDIFLNTGGLHAAALTMMAFARHYVLQIYQPASGNDKNALPDIEDQGFRWFAIYTLLLILVHQFAYYFIERFSLSNFLYSMLRALTGSVFSVALIWLLALLFSPTMRKRKGRR